MRILAALLIAIFVLGGMALYIRFADNITPTPINLSETPATGEYTVDVTLTFDVASSTFSGFEEYGLQIRLADQVLLNSSEKLTAGTPVRIENVDGIKVGRNEFWVFAAPDEDSQDSGNDNADTFGGLETSGSVEGVSSPVLSNSVDRAIRVRVFRDAEMVAQRTIWSQSGEAVQGTVDLRVDGAR